MPTMIPGFLERPAIEVIPGGSGLAHTRAVVNDESLDIIVTHD
jgi:hypothetical protein